MIVGELQKQLSRALLALNLPVPSEIHLEHPADLAHGDYATNIALAISKEAKQNPKSLAEAIVEKIREQKLDLIEKVEVAGPGFINFYLTSSFYQQQIKEILDQGDDYGRHQALKNKKVIVEFTDPNPFKEFHIGHLMSNTIGESIARLIDFAGAELKRACYQGDVGLHVAKAIAYAEATGINWEEEFALGTAYAAGSKKFETDQEFKEKVIEVNKKLYDQSSPELNALYQAGRERSLKYFDRLYQRLGTKFDYFFFESQTGEFGKQVVLAGLKQGVFATSDGAVVYQGEADGLHTRVFINSQGLPTYEAKELGLAKIKYAAYPYDLSLVITGNEINDYFQVLLKVMSLIFPDLAAKTHHLGHGMLRLPSGKMSSRTGEVITAESLLQKVGELVEKKFATREGALTDEEKQEIKEAVAVGAIKYSILRQAIGGNIIFDFDQSISFEGDSGPYLQYTYARTQSVLAKAEQLGHPMSKLKNGFKSGDEPLGHPMSKWLYRFPEVVVRAASEYAPHHLANYLYELAAAFNAYYATTPIIGTDPAASYRLALTAATGQVLKNGLRLLGLQTPSKM